MNSGLGLRMVSKYTRLNSTGIADADRGSQDRSRANNERAVSSSSAQPIKLGANPRNTADTSRVESAVKLPRSKSSAITGSRMAIPTAQAATDARPARANVRSIKRNASRNRNRLPRRAISSSSALDTGLTRNVSGAPIHRRQESRAAAD